jgi:hypothetical protein
MAPDAEQAPPHEFPSWPMNCLSFYCHLAEDYGRFLRTLGGAAANPVQAARAEEDYGISLMHDLTQAWYNLALSPLAAMAKVTADAPAPSAAEPAPLAANEATAKSA